MNDKVKEILQDLYVKATEKPRLVIETFNNYFSEDNVDFHNFIDFDSFLIIVGRMYGNNFSFDAPRKYLSEYTVKEIEKIKNLLFTSVSIKKITDRIYEYVNSIEILVHFPTLKITNEYDKSIDITHLFVKIKIDYEGIIIGSFKLNRSEYTIEQYLSDYMHSHVSGIPYSNMSEFLIPCLGTGPIRDTVNSLARECDIDLWNLFCLELDKYVRTESVNGVPYRKLENVGRKGNIVNRELILISDNIEEYEMPKMMLQSFIIHVLESRLLNYSFKNGKYSLGMSFIEYIITISNEFIKWYNDKFNKKLYSLSYSRLCSYNILIPVYIINNVIYKKSINNNPEVLKNIDRHIEICTFKNNIITLNILQNNEYQDNSYNILNIRIASFIATNILKVLNYEYRNIESANNTGKKTIYI